jgi:hypothetical protein
VAPISKDPKEILKALSQAVNDGVITDAQARAQLEKLAYKPKQ